MVGLEEKVDWVEKVYCFNLAVSYIMCCVLILIRYGADLNRTHHGSLSNCQPALSPLSGLLGEGGAFGRPLVTTDRG